MRRILALFLCLSLLIGIVPLPVFAEEPTVESQEIIDSPIARLVDDEMDDASEVSGSPSEGSQLEDSQSMDNSESDFQPTDTQITDNPAPDSPGVDDASEDSQETPPEDNASSENTEAAELAASILSRTAQLQDIIRFFEVSNPEDASDDLYAAIIDLVNDSLSSIPEAAAAWWNRPSETQSTTLTSLPVDTLESILAQLNNRGINTDSQAETIAIVNSICSAQELPSLSIKEYLTDSRQYQAYEALYAALCSFTQQTLVHVADSYRYSFRYNEEAANWHIQSQKDSSLFLAPQSGNPNTRSDSPVHIIPAERGIMLSNPEGQFLSFDQELGFSLEAESGTCLYPITREGTIAAPLDGFFCADQLNDHAFLLCAERVEVDTLTGSAVSALYLLCPDQAEPILKLKEDTITDSLGMATLEIPLIPQSGDGAFPESSIQGGKNVQLYPESTESRTLTKAFVSMAIPAAASETEFASDNPNERTIPIIAADNVVIAEATLEMPSFTGLSSAADAAFQMIPVSGQENTYYIYSGGKFLYLDGDASNYSNVMSSTNASAVTVSFEGEAVKFASGEKYLYYIPGQGTLANEAGKNDHGKEFAFLDDFALFRKAGDIYYRVNSIDSIEDNGLYVIAVNMVYEGMDCAIVVPSENGGTSTLAGSSINIIGDDHGYSTEIVFTGKTLPDATERSAVFLNCFTVKNTKPGSAAALLGTLAPLDEPAAESETVQLGIIVDSVTSATPVYVINTQQNYSKKDLELSYPKGQTAKPITEDDISIYGESEIDTYVGVGNGGSYNQASIPLSDCLYQFEPGPDSSSYYIRAKKADLGYLNASSHALTDEAATAFKIEEIPGSGLFKLHQVSNDAYVHFWRWKLFITTASPYYKNDKGGTQELLIFKKAASGTEDISSLKGYTLVNSLSEINTTDSYVFAAVYDQQLFFIHPTLNDGNNDHTAMRTTSWARGSCEISFLPHAGTTGYATAKFSRDNTSTTYELDFELGPSTAATEHFIVGTGIGTGSPMSSLVISSGLQFQINVDEALNGKALKWFTSNPSLGRIDQNGLLTVQDPRNMASQERKDFYVYLKADEQFYRLPVTLTKNDYTSTRLFNQYIGALEHTTVYMSYPKMGVNSYALNDNFIPMKEYQATYLLRDVNQNWGAHYFAVPDEGYALAYMSASSSAGQYFKLDDANAENTEYYNNGPCVTQKGLYDDAHTDIIKNMLQYAIDLGCVGAMGFTGRQGVAGAQASVLEFRSEKLPTVKKEVAYVFPANDTTISKAFYDEIRGLASFEPVTGSQYDQYLYSNREGQEVGVGSIVVFKITVDKPANSAISRTTSADEALPVALTEPRRITYKAVTLTESMVDPSLPESITLAKPTFIIPSSMEQYGLTNGASSLNLLNLVNSDNDSEKTYTFYVQFTIPKIRVNDKEYTIGKDIELTNNVNLTTSFRTPYQSQTNLNLYSSARASLTLALTNCLEYVNLSLDDGIRANVFLNLESFQNWYDDSHFIVFELDGKMVDSAKKRISGGISSHFTPLQSSSTTQASGEHEYYRFSLPVSPYDLFKTIKVYIVDSKGARVSNEFSFTVDDYIGKVLNSTNLITSWQVGETRYDFSTATDLKDKLNTLLKCLRTYAGYSLVWRDGGTLHDGVDPITPTDMFKDVSGEAYATDYRANAVTFTGVQHSFPEDKTAINFTVHFTSERPIDTKTAECVVHAISGNVAYSYYYPIEKDDTNSNTYHITVKNIGGKLLGTVFTISLRWSSSIKADSITVKPETYAILLSKAHPASRDYSSLEYMEYALYKYIRASQAFFGLRNFEVAAS